MNRGRLQKVVLFFIFTIFLGIASISFAEQISAMDTGKTSTQNKEESTNTTQTIEKYTINQKDEAVNKAKEMIADLDARIDRLLSRLDKQWNQMDEKAREKARATMHSLREKRIELAEWYGGLKHSSAAAWADIKKGFSKSYEDLKTEFSKAERQY